MPDLKITATKMTDVTVSYISLVGRGANRIPFKIVKQEKAMSKGLAGLDLGALFTRKSDKPKATIVGVATMKNEKLEAVKASLAEAGLDVSQMSEQTDGSVVFAQGTTLKSDDVHQLVRLSDDVVLVTKGFSMYNIQDGSFADKCKVSGAYSGLSGMIAVLHEGIIDLMYNASKPTDAAAAVSKLFDEAKSYAVNLMNQLPVAAFKLDKGVVVKSEPLAPEDASVLVNGTEGAVAASTEDETVEKSDDPKKKDKTKAKDTSQCEGTPAAKAEGAEAAATEAQADPAAGATQKSELDPTPDMMAQFQALMTQMGDSLTSSVTKSIGEVTKNLNDLATRVEQVEGVAKSAEKAVSGFVLGGAEVGDHTPSTKSDEVYVGREIDTAFKPRITHKSSRP